MVFSSLHFLFLFLPFVLLLHYILPVKLRNPFLLLANLIFYAYGEPKYVLLMLASILVNYVLAILVERARGPRGKRGLLVLAVCANLGALVFFKYLGMLLDSLRQIPALSTAPVLSVALPIGISFYTFQAMSYVIDVYRGEVPATRNFMGFAVYISLFPQLIAGPIVRYSDVQSQLVTARKLSMPQFSWGVRMFVIGLAKKILLANQFGLLWSAVSADPFAAGSVAAWCALGAYALQIYFDFSGYSDMARGLGAMLGFDFCVNFDYPYLAKSVSEFWRRWHISLSSWFRDYLYIPLGGGRRGLVRQCLNILIVWTLTGLWHGAGWNFLLWGLYYGLLLVLEKFFLNKWLAKIPAALRWLYAMAAVNLGWVFFASSSFSAIADYFQVLFGGLPGAMAAQMPLWLPLGLIGVLAATPLCAKLWKRLENKSAAVWVEAALCLLGLLLCTGSLASGGYNPFLYFRF